MRFEHCGVVPRTTHGRKVARRATQAAVDRVLAMTLRARVALRR
jgi:hypothetical protein